MHASLGQSDSGTVTVGGFTWEWSRTPLHALPEMKVERTYVHLDDPNNPDQRMMIRLSGDATSVSDRELAELARQPAERTVRDREGQLWVFKPIPSRPRRVTVRGNGNAPRIVELPGDAALGECSNHELLEAAGLL
jgi:hypothetical protein